MFEIFLTITSPIEEVKLDSRRGCDFLPIVFNFGSIEKILIMLQLYTCLLAEQLLTGDSLRITGYNKKTKEKTLYKNNI